MQNLLPYIFYDVLPCPQLYFPNTLAYRSRKFVNILGSAI